MLYGTVVAVEQVLLGSSLVADVAATDTVLVVDHTADFNEDGGLLLLAGATLTYTGLDEGTGTITLASATGVTAETSEPVQVIEAGVPLVQWLAHVALVDPDGDTDSAGDPVPAELPTALVGYFSEGSYDTPVPVELEVAGDTYRVTSQPQVAPVFSGAVLDPLTVPTPRDGLPPGAVTSVATIGALALVFLKWSPVVLNSAGGPQADPVSYDVHVGTSASMPLDGSTLLTTTPGTMVAVRSLPDGTPLQYDTTYWFAVVPYDVDGYGTASAVVGDQMDRAASPDLAVGSVTAAQLASVVILGSTISTRALDSSGNLTGPGLDLTPTGLFSYDSAGNPRVEMPNDSNSPSVFRGDAEIDHLTVSTLTTLQTTLLATGSTLSLASSLANPSNPPSATVTYTTKQYALSLTNMAAWAITSAGLRMAAAVSGTGLFVSTDRGDGTTTIASLAAPGGDAWTFGGMTVGADGTTAYCLVHSAAQAAWFVVTPGTGRYWKLTGTNAPEGTTGYRAPALGYDSASGEFLHAQSLLADGKVRVRRFTLVGTGGTSLGSAGTVAYGTTVTSGTAYAYDLRFVLYGSFDIGSSRYVYGSGTTGATVQVVQTTGTLDTANVWDQPPGVNVAGMVWDGTNFRSPNATGLEYRFENGNKWTASTDSTWFCGYSWRNSTTPAETLVGSSLRTFTMYRRARLVVVTPTLPPGATEARIYLAKGTTAPTVTVASMTANGSTTGTTSPTRTITNASFASLNNFTASTFGTGTPAALQSGAADGAGPLIQLVGNGSGRIGPWSWDAAGNTLTSGSTDTGWVNFTAGTGTIHFAGSTGVTFARYRILNGWCTVQLSRTVLVANDNSASGGNYSNANATASGALPAAARPASSGPNIITMGRMDDTPVTMALTPGGQVILVGGVARAWNVGDPMDVQFVYPVG